MAEVTKDRLRTLVCERFITDERYRNWHINILATAPGTEVLGLHTPEMKAVARELARSSEWKEQLRVWSAHSPLCGRNGLSHEERMIWGLTINYVKCPLEERIELVDNFLPAIDNWAICDTFCASSGWAERADREKVWEYLRSLMDGGGEFRTRTALIMAMSHFTGPGDLGRTLDLIGHSGLREGEPFYVQTGAAWLLATCLRKDPDRTREWIKTASLPEDILRLYVRKARESRVTRDYATGLESVR